MNKLPQVWHPLFSSDNFMRASDDSFFVAIDADDPKFNETKTMAFLSEIGALNVERITIITGPAERRIPKMILAFILISRRRWGWSRSRSSPRPGPTPRPSRTSTSSPTWTSSTRSTPQEAFAPFADERGSQPWVEGTVATSSDAKRRADALANDDHYYYGRLPDPGKPIPWKWADVFPDQVTLDMAFMKRGQNRFDIYCAPCHGSSGDGLGVVHKRAEAVGALATGWAPADHPGRRRTEIRLPHGQILQHHQPRHPQHAGLPDADPGR